MKKLICILCLVMVITGCGFCPAYIRAQSDYQKVANIALSGGSKWRVRTGFREPDDKKVFEDKSEKWTYYNREDGKTFIFIFSPKGAVVTTQILSPEEDKISEKKDLSIDN